MSNVSDRRIKSVALKDGEKTFFIGALLADKEANKSNPDYVSDLDELQSIGQGKGLPFEFVDGEVITFDKFEDCVIVVRHSEFQGKIYSMLSVIADSNKRGKDLEVPMAIFRRVPALQEEYDWLVNDSPLNERLTRSTLSDLNRLFTLAGHKLSVNGSKYCAKQFSVINGKRTRLSREVVSELSEDDMKKLARYFCYRVSID